MCNMCAAYTHSTQVITIELNSVACNTNLSLCVCNAMLIETCWSLGFALRVASSLSEIKISNFHYKQIALLIQKWDCCPLSHSIYKGKWQLLRIAGWQSFKVSYNIYLGKWVDQHWISVQSKPLIIPYNSLIWCC